MENMSKEISIVKISNLKMKNKNRNHHPEDQIVALAENIKYQGFRNPLIVSNQSGEIVCGNGRYLAAIRAGMKELPVIFQDYENSDMEYAHHVADNALGLRSELDFAGINSDVEILGPDFNIEMLGIKNFTLDISEKGFDPSETTEMEKDHKRCPHCDGIL